MKEVLNLDDLDRIMGKRPFLTLELRNVDKFRGHLSQWLPTGDGIWSWIDAFRSPGLPLAFDAAPGIAGSAAGAATSGAAPGDDDEDDGGSGGGGGGEREDASGPFTGWWADEAEKSATKVKDMKQKYPTAT